jgi:hypothetical protein
MGHWFDEKHVQAQREAEQNIQIFGYLANQRFTEIDEKITVNLQDFANDAKTGSLEKSEDLRNRLIGESQSRMNEYAHTNSEGDLKKLEETFAKINIMERVIDFKITERKIQIKQQGQLEPMKRLLNNFKETRLDPRAHGRQIETLDQLIRDETNQIKLLGDDLNTKRDLINKTVKYYQENTFEHKAAAASEIRKSEGEALKTQEQIRKNALQLREAPENDRFIAETLRMVQRSQTGLQVEQSMQQIVKLNAKQDEVVRIAKKYVQLKRATEDLSRNKNKAKSKSYEDLSSMFK